jgi:hypothetical protein
VKAVSTSEILTFGLPDPPGRNHPLLEQNASQNQGKGV